MALCIDFYVSCLGLLRDRKAGCKLNNLVNNRHVENKSAMPKWVGIACFFPEGELEDEAALRPLREMGRDQNVVRGR